MAKENLQVIAPDKTKHAARIIDLVSKTFSGWLGFYSIRKLFENRILHGNYDWDASRIGIIGGRVVTHYGVWGYDMRIGASTVKTGGIGVVATDPDYRKKGLMKLTANASIDAMRNLGYDMTILFGIDNYYHKFGYVRAWSEREYTIDVADLPRDKPRYRLYKFALKQRDDIDAIYNAENKTFTGAAVRPTYTKTGMPPDCQGYLWRDGRGRTIGYIIVSAYRGFVCHEVGGKIDDIMRALALVARKGAHKELKFFTGLHCNHPLARRIRRGNFKSLESGRKCGGAMVRLINLKSTLAKIAPQLSRRLKNSLMLKWNGYLAISSSDEKVFLKIAAGKISVAEKGPSKNLISAGNEIVQLLIGADDPERIIEDAGIKVTGEAKQLAPILFPNEHPTLAMWDRY